jgi:4-amino-4-deoxy-L-arabinose transferase-like glycosyltransferase
MMVAFFVLLPFWNKPFTTDDYVFLREAGQSLITPLKPLSALVVWQEDLLLPASRIVPTGPVIAWLLVPVALSGYSEWLGHVIIFTLFLASISGAALMALRLGCNSREARLAALLLACTPAALGMAGTLMPDIPSLALAVFGIERLLAWRTEGGLAALIVSGLLLGIGIVTRSHLALLLPVAVVLLYRRPLWQMAQSLLPVWVALAVMLSFVWLSRDTSDHAGTLSGATAAYAGTGNILKNTKSFFANWTLATPFVGIWLVSSWRRRWTWAVFGLAVAAGTRSVLRHGDWYVIPIAILGMGMLADLGWQVWRRRDLEMAALYAWLWIAFPVVLYVHMPSKYLLPSLPAAAILTVRIVAVKGRVKQYWIGSTVAAGFFIGFLILYADARDGDTVRAVVREQIASRVAKGERVWSIGHWGYQWYAEREGAQTVARNRLPAPNEVIVVNEDANCVLVEQLPNRERLVAYTVRSYGPQVMNSRLGAGFYSNGYGILPLAWGASDIHIDLWRLQKNR